MHGPFDRVAAKLDTLQASGAGAFVTVNETDFKGREARNIVRIRALFLDLDGASLSAGTRGRARAPHRCRIITRPLARLLACR